MPLADPVVLETPVITINSVDYVCAARSVSLIPSDMKADVKTFCNPGGERPSSTTWTLDVEILLSFGAVSTGTWNTLNAIRKTRVTCTVKYDDGATAITNPLATFDIYVPSIPFVNGKIGDAMPITLTAVVIGEPVFTTA